MIRLLILSLTLLIISCSQPEACIDIKVINGVVYKKGEIYTGKCSYYDDNNGKTISSHEYNKGKFHGKWKFFYPNGQLETIGNFDNGLRVCTWFYYYSNGNKSQISIYDKGKKNGIWKVYDENGNLTFEQEWSEGVAVIDTNRLKNDYQDIKIDGYDVKPILVNPNSD